MEDRLSYIYENSLKILDLIKKGKLAFSDVKKMIFKGDDSFKLMLDNYNISSNVSIDGFDQYLGSKEIITAVSDNTLLSRRKEVLDDIEFLFYNYYLVKEGLVSMDTNQLLLEKFMYLFNNCEAITDFIDLSDCNLTSSTFRIPQLEALLLEHKYLNEDENCAKIEAYKRTADNISSYDTVHSISLTWSILDKLVSYIQAQKKDIINKNKKLKVMDKYYQLLNHIRNEIVIKNTCIGRKKDGDRFPNRLEVKMPSVSALSHINLPGKNHKVIPLANRSSISRDANDIGVKNNSFINNNTLTTIKENDEKIVLESVKKEKGHVKELHYNCYKTV